MHGRLLLLLSRFRRRRRLSDILVIRLFVKPALTKRCRKANTQKNLLMIISIHANESYIERVSSSKRKKRKSNVFPLMQFLRAIVMAESRARPRLTKRRWGSGTTTKQTSHFFFLSSSLNAEMSFFL